MEPKFHHDPSSSIFLTGSLLFAGLDSGALTEYAAKALIGGVIWMAFKLATDFIGEKLKKK